MAEISLPSQRILSSIFIVHESPNGLIYHEKGQDLRYNHLSKEENGKRDGRVNAPIEQYVRRINLDIPLKELRESVAEASECSDEAA